MPALREIGEPPVRLGYRARGLERRQRRRKLPPPRERPEKLPLLALLRRHPTLPLPRTGLGNPSQPPRGRRKSRHQQEGNGQDQEEREEVKGGTNYKEQKQPSHHQPNREPRRERPTVRCHRPPPTSVAHHAPTVHLASSVQTTCCDFAVYHDISR